MRSRTAITFALIILIFCEPLIFSFGAVGEFYSPQTEAVESGASCDMVMSLMSIVNRSRHYAESLFEALDEDELDSLSGIEALLDRADDAYEEAFELMEESRCNESSILFAEALQLYGITINEILNSEPEPEGDVYEDTVRLIELKGVIERAYQILNSLNETSGQLRGRGLNTSGIYVSLHWAWTLLQQVEGLIEDAKFDEAEEILSEAEELLDEAAELIERFSEEVATEKASRFLNKTKGRIAKLENHMFRIFEAANVSADAIDLVKEIFTGLYTDLDDMEDSLGLDDLEDLLDSLDDLFDDLDDAYEILDEEVEGASDYVGQLEAAEAWMESLEETLDELAEEDLDTFRPASYLTISSGLVQAAYEAIESFDLETVEDRLDEIEDFMDEVEDWIHETIEEYEDEMEEYADEMEDIAAWSYELESIFEWVETMAAEFNESSAYAEEIEHLINETRSLLVEAKGYVDGEDFVAGEILDEAEDLLQEALDIIDYIVDEIEHSYELDEEARGLADWMSEIETAMEIVENKAAELRDSGVEIEGVEELLNAARSMLDAAETYVNDSTLDAAEDRVQEALGLIEDALAGQAIEPVDTSAESDVMELSESLKQRLADIEEALDQFDVDEWTSQRVVALLDEAKNMMDEAVADIANEDYEDALGMLEDIEPILNAIMDLMAEIT